MAMVAKSADGGCGAARGNPWLPLARDFPDIDDENWRVRIVSRRNADSTISINLRKVPR